MAKRATSKATASAPAGAARVAGKVGGSFMADSLANLITGMGGDKDKLAATMFGVREVTQPQLEAAYRGDWIARKSVDIPAYDSTREWRSWEIDKDDITDIEDAEKALNIVQKTKLAMQKARLYGGGALILGMKDEAPEKEINIDTVKKGDLKFVHAVSRYDIQAGDPIDDLMSPFYGEPVHYTRNSTKTGMVTIHPSRVIRLQGLDRLDETTRGWDGGWGDSVLQIVNDAILSCGLVSSSIAQLVSEAKLDIIKIPDLTENIMTAGYEAKLSARFAAANIIKSIYSMLLIDKEEEWERQNVQFSGLPDILKMYLLMASGAADIPATRMLGQAPTGLSATGDSDTRNYYDRISNDQRNTLAPAMSRLDEVLIRSVFGTKPEGIFYNWNPLWQLDAKDKSTIATQKAQVFTSDVNAALIPSDVLRDARINQLIEDGTYPGLEQILEEYGDLETTEGDVNDPNETVDPLNDPNNEAAIQAANENAPPPKKGTTKGGKPKPSFAKEAAARVRKAANDARPRTLYVRRNVINAGEIIAWAKSQGFETSQTTDSMVPKSELHVTIIHTRSMIDWMKIPRDWSEDDKTGQISVAPGGPRSIEVFKGDAVVLSFASQNLYWRNGAIREYTGAEVDFPEYQPHMTLTYAGLPNGKTVDDIIPYRGRILLGPEIFEEVSQDWVEELNET